MQPSQICTAIVPECPFPYENPIDLQFPLHFDDSAELCSLRTENGDDPREVAERPVEDDFVTLVENFDKPFDGGIRICFAITGAARAADPFRPRGTELFFNVEMISTKHFEGISGVRQIIRYTLGGLIDY
ncbi:hypothetical protein Slin15195_G021880 [Septoria linicola]|uniref:Uncharacterized protein n=1 Tax=Septoria linicola TaxID=215465 RepID=A0A9Q9EGF4_9PEZI|nr:hypothetical protein Slin15195_G021880 [Septoria linicola]